MTPRYLKYTKHLFAFLDQGIVSGTNFCLAILITRFSGVATYGQFSLFWMVYLFLQGLSIAYIGLPMQVLSQEKKDKNQYLEKSIHLSNYILIALLPVIYMGMSIYTYFDENLEKGTWFWLFPIVVVLFIKHDVHRKYFYAKGQNKKVLFLDISGYLFQTPLLFLISLYKTVTIHEIVATLLACILVSNCTFYFLKEKNSTSFSTKELPYKENWNYAKHLLTTTVLQWFSGNYFIIIAASLLGTGAVGIIKIFQNLMGILNVLFSTLENIIPPKAGFLFNEGGKKALYTYIKKVTIYVGMGYLLILLALKLFGKNIISIIYGSEYIQHSYLINYFIVIYVFVFLGTISQIVIKTLRLNFSIFIAYVITMITTAIIATPLVSNYGILGVVYGFIILQIMTVSTYIITLNFTKKCISE
ncbi:lipopolysaccharide biosynthesis protein [Wenyingzhuangia aestuarii]|uniref:lipopolysaccharide biosynthesis protein n=1 Tax=Wenyingzhuangia aestuarii TaxID=1647582 RepID=UPI00143AD09A|nr:lipopolysaccharide biosynthesis protein [Wenyingzhuangia aestuarii]NJB82460.1 O-antigen/teichoic acid export membrane protein [Wenyingzhuangia aestuarii]